MHLLFDIGGTKMRLGVSKDGDTLMASKIIPAAPNFSDGLLFFKKVAAELLGGEKVETIAGGIAGPLDRERAKLMAAPNLAGWAGKPLRAELEKHFGAPVFLENDAAIVGLGEAVYGAGKGKKIVAYLTVSTGVGGARMVDGRIDQNAMGFEPGHQIVAAGGLPCSSCGAPGHLEGYISGRGMNLRYGKPVAEITDPTVWDEAARWLAFGLNNVIVHRSPDVVVLGGASMIRTPGISLEAVRHYLAGTLKIFFPGPEIVRAALGDVGGLWGALAYLRATLRR